MLTSLHFAGFRAFESLDVERLTRVNVLVGRNNAGKSSILEGVDILMSGGTVDGLWRVTRRRGETVVVSLGEERDRIEADIRQVFFQRRLTIGSQLTIRAEGQPRRECQFAIVDAAGGQADLALPDEEPASPLAVQASSTFFPQQPTVQLSSAGSLSAPSLRRRTIGTTDMEPPFPVLLVGTNDFDASRLGPLWDSIVLTPDEQRVVAAVRIIEPRVEGIAFLGRTTTRAGGAVVKFEGEEQRLPLGSMGDGVKHLLTLALTATRATGGILLVDEIETGLHHSIMSSMWRMMIETARSLDVQVFCTTHSNDCLRMLAELCQVEPAFQTDVSVHRVDRTPFKVTRYSGEELRVAVEHDMEIR
jgi:hypothetical protein